MPQFCPGYKGACPAVTEHMARRIGRAADWAGLEAALVGVEAAAELGLLGGDEVCRLVRTAGDRSRVLPERSSRCG